MPATGPPPPMLHTPFPAHPVAAPKVHAPSRSPPLEDSRKRSSNTEVPQAAKAAKSAADAAAEDLVQLLEEAKAETAGAPPRRRKLQTRPPHPSVTRWPGPDTTPWEVPAPLLLETEVKYTLPAGQAARAPLEGQDTEDPADTAGEVQVPAETATGSPAEGQDPIVMPLWGRTIEWVELRQVALEAPVSWWQRGNLASTELKVRAKARKASQASKAAHPQDAPSPWEPFIVSADVKEASRTPSMLLSVGGQTKRAVTLTEWRAPVRLKLPEDVVVDPSKYRGTERSNRGKKGPREAVPRSTAGVTQVAVNLQESVKPKPLLQEALSADYTTKLVVLMNQLQQANAEPSTAVRELWAILSAEERVRFSTEFPQFMHLVMGLPVQAVPRPMGPTMVAPMMVPQLVSMPGMPPVLRPVPVLTATMARGPMQAAPMMTVMARPSMQAAPVMTAQPMRAPMTAPLAPMMGTQMAPMVPGNMVRAAYAAPTSWAAAPVVQPIPATPAAPNMVPRMPDADRKRCEAAWADRVTFHAGVLRVDMQGMNMTDIDMAHWCAWAPGVLEALSSAEGGSLKNATLNFSSNLIEDGGLRQMAALLQSLRVHCGTLNLDKNRLTDQSLHTITELVANSPLPVREIRMEHNLIQGQGVSQSIVRLAKILKQSPLYPMLSDAVSRFTPFILRLADNKIELPMSITQQLREVLGSVPSLAEARLYWLKKEQCPPLQLPSFERQQTLTNMLGL